MIRFGPARGTRYRGGVGQWSFVAHRISGVAIFGFLLVHVLDTALVWVSPEAYNAVMGTYHTPVMALAEAGLVAAVVFHALNGLRILLLDAWGAGARFARPLFLGVVALFLVVMAGFLPVHLSKTIFGGS